MTLSNPSMGIRSSIRLWVGAILIGFLLLTGGLIYGSLKLHAETGKIVFDSRSLAADHRFELAILLAAREDSLWRIDHSPHHKQSELVQLEIAESIIPEMKVEADSARELSLVNAIVHQYQEFRQSLKSSSTTNEVAVATNELLAAVHRHRVLNDSELNDTVRTSNRLNALINAWVIVLIVTATVMLIVGSIRVWLRMFRPTLALAEMAASFGQGNLQARAPILRDDEMGSLSRTFNVMAEAICNREKERLQFIATVAHDLKNPLVVIGGAASLLKRKEERLTPEERVEWLTTIEKYTWRLETMIADLTDSVQIETGLLTLRKEPLEFGQLVAEVVRDQASAITTHHLNFKGDEGCTLLGDRRRLERVVTNLISNATKYSPEGCDVGVAVERQETRVKLIVKDHGVGIAPEDLEKLFTPFARLERTQSMAAGTGLGLSSVKKIVEAHDGSVRIASQLGVGTTVEVALPLSPAQGHDTPHS